MTAVNDYTEELQLNEFGKWQVNTQDSLANSNTAKLWPQNPVRKKFLTE